MIYIAEACNEKEFNGVKIYNLDFNCEHCKQFFNDYTFNLSVFLYGAAILIGQKFSCIGITCPSCLKTTMLKGGERLKNLMTELTQSKRQFSGPDNSYWFPEIRYHSSVNHTPSQIEHLKSLEILSWESELTDILIENFYGELVSILDEEPYYEKEYMNSYFWKSEVPIGWMSAVWWFKPDDIEPLVQIENEHKFRVFPRYVHKMTWYERYDAFCWKYKLNEEYWAGKIKIHNEETNKLRELAYKEGLNLDRLYEDNPGIIKAEHFQLILEEVQKDPANDIEVALDFLNLLLNFNPAPWDFASSSRDYYESLWKSITPFKNDSVPDCVEELKPEEYKPSMSDAEVDEIICEIQPLVRKGYVQDWAADNHQKFIEKYTSLARRSDFSYGYVWDLKCRYLKQLYAFLNKKIIEEAKYAFFAEGQTWTITYNEKTIRGLRGKGFKILHYLVSNQNKSFFPEELDLLDGVALEHMNEDPGIKRSSNSVKASIDLSKLSKPKTHHLNKIHGKSENELKREYNKKKAALEKAKHDGDPLIIEEAQKNLDEIKEYSLEYFGKGGKVKKFKKKESKVVKDRIAINIKRALATIKKNNNVIWKHFDKSTASPYSNDLCYRPSEEIEWRCE